MTVPHSASLGRGLVTVPASVATASRQWQPPPRASEAGAEADARG